MEWWYIFGTIYCNLSNGFVCVTYTSMPYAEDFISFHVIVWQCVCFTSRTLWINWTNAMYVMYVRVWTWTYIYVYMYIFHAEPTDRPTIRLSASLAYRHSFEFLFHFECVFFLFLLLLVFWRCLSVIRDKTYQVNFHTAHVQGRRRMCSTFPDSHQLIVKDDWKQFEIVLDGNSSDPISRTVSTHQMIFTDVMWCLL